MKKPVFAMLLGGVLGVFDGLSALLSAPEVRPMIAGIVAGSTFKGVVAGLIVGLVAQRTQSLPIIVGVGLVVGAFFVRVHHHRKQSSVHPRRRLNDVRIEPLIGLGIKV